MDRDTKNTESEYTDGRRPILVPAAAERKRVKERRGKSRKSPAGEIALPMARLSGPNATPIQPPRPPQVAPAEPTAPTGITVPSGAYAPPPPSPAAREATPSPPARPESAVPPTQPPASPPPPVAPAPPRTEPERQAAGPTGKPRDQDPPPPPVASDPSADRSAASRETRDPPGLGRDEPEPVSTPEARPAAAQSIPPPDGAAAPPAAPPRVEYLDLPKPRDPDPVAPPPPAVEPPPVRPDLPRSTGPVRRDTGPRRGAAATDGDIWVGVPGSDLATFLDPPPPRDTLRFVEGGARPFAVTICHGIAATVYEAWAPVPDTEGPGEFRELDGNAYRRIGSQRRTPTEFMLAYSTILEAYPTLREDGEQQDGRILTVDVS